MRQQRSRTIDALAIAAVVGPVVALLVLVIDGLIFFSGPTDATPLALGDTFPWMLLIAPLLLVAGFTVGYRTKPLVALLVILIAIAEERFQQSLLPQGGINLRLDELLAPSITLGLLAREWLAGRLRQSLAHVPGLIPLGLFLVANLVPTALIMHDRARGASLFIILLAGAVCYVGVAMLAARVGSVEDVVLPLAIIGGLEAAFGLSALALSVWQGQPTAFGVQVDPVTQIIEPYGTMYEANFFGQYLAAIVLIAIAFLYERVAQGRLRSWVTPMLLLVAAIAVSGVLASETRASWLGLVAGIVVLMLLWPLRGTQQVERDQPRERKLAHRLATLALPLLLAVFALAAVAFAGSNTPVSQRLSSLLDFTSGSGYGRIRVLQLVLGDLSNPVVGMGDGSFNLALPAAAGAPPDGHPWIYSMFLAVFHDSGIVGLALWLAFLTVIYVRLVGVIRSNAPAPVQTFAIAMGAVLTSLLISAQATTSMYLILFWAFLGLAGALPGMVRSVQEATGAGRQIHNPVRPLPEASEAAVPSPARL